MSVSLPARFAKMVCASVALVLIVVVGCSRAGREEMAMQSDHQRHDADVVLEPANQPKRETEIATMDSEAKAETKLATESVEFTVDVPSLTDAVESPPIVNTAESEINVGTPPGEGNFVPLDTARSRAKLNPKGIRKTTSSAQPRSTATRSKVGVSNAPSTRAPSTAASSSVAPNANAPTATAPTSTGPFSSLPAGSSHDTERGFATVQVFYATDRKHGSLPLSAYELTGRKQTFIALSGASVFLIVVSALGWLLSQPKIASGATILCCVTGIFAMACVLAGHANIEKHGVTYTADRGTLARGICEVTVPDTHQKGTVERPSLLRFEIREDQREHIVLTSATELSAVDFKTRLSKTVSSCPERDLLVFIHGYNVDFESAVQRTAQIAVDLPFEGVPVCYSWPSQATLLGYSIDETNAAWTGTHLKHFLLELARESDAQSINVIAHSMGNRPMTEAMRQIRWEWDSELDVPFDRVVLAAPDVDADSFRRDLAPALLNVAEQVTLYASSDDQALVASKQVHGYPRAGESGEHIVVVDGIETIDVSGIDLSLLGHSYYGDNASMLNDLYQVVRSRLPATHRELLVPRRDGKLTYWQLSQRLDEKNRR